MVILLISVCNEKLHENEFVLPIKNLIESSGNSVLISHCIDLSEEDLKIADKVIICGTSLKDFSYLGRLNKFSWIKDLNKPLLGICSGMQILGKVFNCKIGKKTEIGLFEEEFEPSFLGLSGKKEVWHLHNNFVEFNENWDIFSKSGKVIQAVKHKEKDLYGVLFHPEVRNKLVLENFLRL